MNRSLLEIQSTLNVHTLTECVSKLINVNIHNVTEWNIAAVSCMTLNFTTDGIFRIFGTEVISEKEISWSLILKIIKPDQDDENNPQHHNYWKREALVNQSGMLTDLHDVIYTPQCYKVEEKEDGSVWIWMEEIKEDNKQLWSEKEFSFVTRQLGIFNATYILDKSIPQYPWICCKWLTSWVNSCKKYSIDPTSYISKVENQSELEPIYHSYLQLHQDIDRHLNALDNLPRVLAHQDLSKQNIYLNLHNPTRKQLTLIDWQFLSISGLGEDLGKLFGVALSQQDIPIEKVDHYKELLFTSYVGGLREAGWHGDVALPQYGFYMSFALRSAWEVPKLIKLAADYSIEREQEILQEIELLTRITNTQMQLGKEANRLCSGLLI